METRKQINLSHIKEGSIGDFTISKFKVEPKDMAHQWGSSKYKR